MARDVKSEGTDALSDELDAINAKNAEQDQRLDDMNARLSKLEQDNPDPEPPDPEPPEPSGDPWPSGWDDPRFTGMREATSPQGGDLTKVSIKTTSGDPMCSGRNIRTCRFSGREGPRIGESGTYTLEDIYCEVGGTGSDHADGLQVYAPGKRPTIIMRRFKIVVLSQMNDQPTTGNNCAWFSADHAEADITLEDGWIDGSAASGAHGALWLPCDSKNNDKGCVRFSGKNLVLKGQRHRNPFEPGPSYSGITIVKWENIRDEKGNPIPKPF